MQNKESDKNKIILGAIIGGLIGGTALYFLNRTHRKPLMNKVSRALSDLEERIEESEILNSGIDEIEKILPKAGDVVSDAVSWMTKGLSLWNKFKRGN